MKPEEMYRAESVARLLWDQAFKYHSARYDGYMSQALTEQDRLNRMSEAVYAYGARWFHGRNVDALFWGVYALDMASRHMVNDGESIYPYPDARPMDPDESHRELANVIAHATAQDLSTKFVVPVE